jgi:DNA repair exonuclease SbcCD ATPase subunit
LLVAGEGAALTFDVAAARNRPVSKVMTLLKDMLKQLEKEAAEDQEIYDNLACWCTTNDQEKSKAIADAEAKIDSLEDLIKELTATSARLNQEIATLEEEVATETKALATATKLREEQIAEFEAEEKDLLESIAALGAAVDVLSTHQGAASLLQMPKASAQSVAATLQHVMQKQAPLLKGVLTHKDRRAIAAFVQAPGDYFDAAPTFKQSYAPQSGEIYGVLTQMKETFEKDLADAQAEETKNQKAYEELKALKEAQIAAAKAAIAKKTQELADVDEKNAQAKVDLEDTKNSLSADQKFLMMLKEKCSLTDKEFQERTATRQLEMEAVSKAMTILSGDDAHDLFARTFNPAAASFLQSGATQHSQRRQQASKLLSKVASKTHNPRLAQLAVRVKLDAFTKVKKAIDDMIAMLLQEKADEIKHKDFCTDELNTNQLQTEKKTREKLDLEAHIEDLQNKIKKLTDEILTLEAEVADLQLELKRVSEDREKASSEFQTTVMEQRAAQALLKKALEVLKGFYGIQEAAAAQQEPVGPPPPPGFKEYKKNAMSGGVMAEITQIIEDAEAMEKDAIKFEADEEATYEAFVMDTNASIEAKVKEHTRKVAERAKTEAELVETKKSLAEVMNTLQELSDYNAELHLACDYILKNFDIRQTARDEEVEALKQAKAILSGANFEEFLQQR